MLIYWTKCKLLTKPSEKTKEAMLLAPKPLQPGLYPSPGGSAPLPMPSLVPTPGERLGPGALLLQRQGDEERWLARQRRLRADTADRQGPACSQHSTEPEIHDPQTDTQRWEDCSTLLLTWSRFWTWMALRSYVLNWRCGKEFTEESRSAVYWVLIIKLFLILLLEKRFMFSSQDTIGSYVLSAHQVLSDLIVYKCNDL